jgi:hypothetical protein
VGVHRAADADDAAGGAERGEIVGVEVGGVRRLVACGEQTLLERERRCRERRGMP